MTFVSPKSLKVKALAMLSRREHSRAELKQKLGHSSENVSSVDLDAVLDDLESQGYLSDARFLESFVRQRSAKHGLNKILHDLRAHQIDSDLIEQLSAELQGSEFERAMQVWRKKFNQRPDNPHDKAKQMRFLLARGFSSRVINKVFSESVDIDAD